MKKCSHFSKLFGISKNVYVLKNWIKLKKMFFKFCSRISKVVAVFRFGSQIQKMFAFSKNVWMFRKMFLFQYFVHLNKNVCISKICSGFSNCSQFKISVLNLKRCPRFQILLTNTKNVHVSKHVRELWKMFRFSRMCCKFEKSLTFKYISSIVCS